MLAISSQSDSHESFRIAISGISFFSDSNVVSQLLAVPHLTENYYKCKTSEISANSCVLTDEATPLKSASLSQSFVKLNA
jgi:hypothetical protein